MSKFEHPAMLTVEKMRKALVGIRDMEPFRTAEQLAAMAEAALEEESK